MSVCFYRYKPCCICILAKKWEDKIMELCNSCENECNGAHSCKVCKKPCHAIEPCSFKIESNHKGCGSNDDAVYGAVVTCRKCSKKEKPKPSK